MLKPQSKNRRNPRRLHDGNRPLPLTATAVNSVVANKWRISTNVPVVVRGLPVGFKVNGVSPIAVTVIDQNTFDLTYAVNVAVAQTFVIPANEENVRTQRGGFVAAAAGTF